MGNLHKIAKKHGGNVNRNPSQQRKGPLKRIVALITPSNDTLFSRPYVELECGHRVHSDGISRARCPYCQEDILLAEAGIEEYAERLRKIDEGECV